MAADLSAALGGEKGAIRVNEVRFVAQDSSLGDTGMAALLAARSLGADAQKLQALINDPQRLLQLIAAAEGARNQAAATGGCRQWHRSARGAREGPSKRTMSSKYCDGYRSLARPQNIRIHSSKLSPSKRTLNRLPPTGQAALAQALMSMSSQSDPPRPDDPMLVQLAERVAVRFALERYDRGDVKTNAVVELLDRLKHEIGTLRNILKVQEEKMGRAGLDVESHADILDQQFWARVPDRAKRKMLLSPEAWAVPPRNIRQFVEDLLGRGDTESARAILDNYAQCIYAPDADARRKASTGLTEMADLFYRANHSLLKSSLHHMGEALSREGNPDLQSLLGASFVRFSHEAAARRQYPAVHEALRAMEMLEQTAAQTGAGPLAPRQSGQSPAGIHRGSCARPAPSGRPGGSAAAHAPRHGGSGGDPRPTLRPPG